VTCGGRAEVPGKPVREVLAGRVLTLGGSTRVRRLLPTLGRRMVGAWCFIDHYGPDDIEREPGMAEEIVMWWNFVARSHAEIAEAREAWMTGDRFGTVTGYDGAPLPAPTLPDTPLKPRGLVR